MILRIRIFVIVFMMLWLLPALAKAQTLGGSVSNSESTIYSEDLNDPSVLWPISTTYSNWKWTDNNGIIRYFNGSTKTNYKYLYYPDGTRKLTGTTSTSLTQIQATDGSSYYLYATGGQGYINGNGRLSPKYQVVSIIYSAPGINDSVDYSATSIAGISTNVSKSFSNGMQFSAEVGGGIFIADATTTYSAGWTTTKTSSNTLSVSKTIGSSLISQGQVNPPYGVDHDFDQIAVCLNPVMLFAASTSPSVANNPLWTIACDSNDPYAGGGPDIIYLTVAELKNPSLMSAPLRERLNRTWAGPGQDLTIEDFNNILRSNPFSNDGTNGTRPSFNSSLKNNRFKQVGSIYYAALAPGQGPQLVQGDIEYSTSDATTSESQDVYSVSTSTKGSVDFFVKINLNSTSNYTWTNKTSETLSSGSIQKSGYSVWRPPTNWTGATEIIVWQDMVYGTFLFSY
ncbi:hypothetical protein [Geothrix mesophila]|uniref:hypothetical protein n=1 Tax=Geothrix mesophila TaxID=2922723 RepID=UPI001FAE262F|nr:hypothetical protein [Geothrix sp. SG198]